MLTDIIEDIENKPNPRPTGCKEVPNENQT